MDDRVTRGLGASTGVGAVLAVVTSVPSEWYGVRETDAYVFDPALLSPLWIERTLVPVVSLLALAMLVVGLAALVVRDRGVAGQLRRWSGYVATAGMTLLWGSLLAFTVGMAASRGGSVLLPVLLILGGGLGVLGALVLLVPGAVAMGVGYVRSDRPAVGYALAGGIGLATLVGVAFWVVDPDTGIGFLPVVVPFAGAFGGVAHELWTHTDPVEDADAPGDATPGRAGTERTPPDEDADGGRAGTEDANPDEDADRGWVGDANSDDDATEGRDHHR